jgi:hypothetical protein
MISSSNNDATTFHKFNEFGSEMEASYVRDARRGQTSILLLHLLDMK